jgi:hypothetical protein
MSDTEIAFTGTYTCTHHTACPVCLVTALTAERERAERYRLATLKLDAELAAERARMKKIETDHKCLYEVRERCELWKQRAEKAEADLAKYLSACPASPTEEERKRCQQWWSISGRAS